MAKEQVNLIDLLKGLFKMPNLNFMSRVKGKENLTALNQLIIQFMN